MGKLVDGKWVSSSVITSNDNGKYDREPRTFLEVISNEHPVFKPESGRYHLYVSYACPWATRVLVYRSLKELEKHISVSVVHPDMLDFGWSFSTSFKHATGDDLYGFDYLYQIYQKALPGISTSVTVPILWDKGTETIVNNESSQIIRILNTAFNTLTGNQDDYYPEKLRIEIDTWNEKIYHYINNGVYLCGFAKTQEAYDEAAAQLFSALDELDAYLENKKYLVGNRLTEADLRLIPTLLRFDLVYYLHFKTNLRKISEYSHLYRYTRNMYSIDAVKKNHYFDHIKRHYFYSHTDLNPYRLIPIGPEKFI